MTTLILIGITLAIALTFYALIKRATDSNFYD